MADPLVYQKENMTIPKEVELVITLLKDKLRNHKLLQVVKEENILTHYPTNLQHYPAIYVKKVSTTPMINNQAIPGGIGYTWQAEIQIEISTSDDSFAYYPPHEPGEADSGDARYDDAENVLNMVGWIVHAIIMENRSYEDAFDTTFQIDNVTPVEIFRLTDGGYRGVADIWAITMTYNMNFEIVMRDNS